MSGSDENTNINVEDVLCFWKLELRQAHIEFARLVNLSIAAEKEIPTLDKVQAYAGILRELRSLPTKEL